MAFSRSRPRPFRRFRCTSRSRSRSTCRSKVWRRPGSTILQPEDSTGSPSRVGSLLRRQRHSGRLPSDPCPVGLRRRRSVSRTRRARSGDRARPRTPRSQQRGCQRFPIASEHTSDESTRRANGEAGHRSCRLRRWPQQEIQAGSGRQTSRDREPARDRTFDESSAPRRIETGLVRPRRAAATGARVIEGSNVVVPEQEQDPRPSQQRDAPRGKRPTRGPEASTTRLLGRERRHHRDSDRKLRALEHRHLAPKRQRARSSRGDEVRSGVQRDVGERRRDGAVDEDLLPGRSRRGRREGEVTDALLDRHQSVSRTLRYGHRIIPSLPDRGRVRRGGRDEVSEPFLARGDAVLDCSGIPHLPNAPELLECDRQASLLLVAKRLCEERPRRGERGLAVRGSRVVGRGAPSRRKRNHEDDGSGPAS